MNETPVATIIGCGYVGLTTAAILANCGVTVYALEINPSRLNAIKAGRSFFYEEGIDALIIAGLSSGRLIPTDSYEESVPSSDFVFSCVGTPDQPDGSSNLSYVYDAAGRAGTLMKPDTLFIQKSTVPVGTGQTVQDRFRANGIGVAYVSNPEFLREGTAVQDTLWFDRIVAGSDDPAAASRVLDLYRLLQQHRDSIAATAGLAEPVRTPRPSFTRTSLSSAELIKVSANAFLALKVSFANSVAKLADQAGADIKDVMDAVGADRRIGRAFLNAGRGYGGGCFPKDVSSLIRSAEDHGVAMEIMAAAVAVNDSMPHYVIARTEDAYGRGLGGIKVAVLGVAFKAGTSDVRRSPGIVIANTLAKQGAVISVYDPEAMGEAEDQLIGDIIRCDSLDKALKDTQIVIITTDWPQFKELGTAGLAEASNAQLIVDAMNCLERPAADAAYVYIGVGR